MLGLHPDSLLNLKDTTEQDMRRLKELCLQDKSDAVTGDPVDEMSAMDSIMCNFVNES